MRISTRTGPASVNRFVDARTGRFDLMDRLIAKRSFAPLAMVTLNERVGGTILRSEIGRRITVADSFIACPLGHPGRRIPACKVTNDLTAVTGHKRWQEAAVGRAMQVRPQPVELYTTLGGGTLCRASVKGGSVVVYDKQYGPNEQPQEFCYGRRTYPRYR